MSKKNYKNISNLFFLIFQINVHKYFKKMIKIISKIFRKNVNKFFQNSDAADIN